jgi:hypothetical protein
MHAWSVKKARWQPTVWDTNVQAIGWTSDKKEMGEAVATRCGQQTIGLVRPSMDRAVYIAAAVSLR